MFTVYVDWKIERMLKKTIMPKLVSVTKEMTRDEKMKLLKELEKKDIVIEYKELRTAEEQEKNLSQNIDKDIDKDNHSQNIQSTLKNYKNDLMHAMSF